ncbi:hypothetical protein RZO55_10110 [Clostridium boliviensis]|uniref:DUF3139 domain-containing protein n=1 Tax=Clostridium boliviensis TaxID=318465 RepID=A0ABU4GJY1_9CLOT|nr:hypothetical protein [Clostridium boliviensis]MDW2797927.1 hypothetical protein [Clostridium boliviensis]
MLRTVLILIIVIVGCADLTRAIMKHYGYKKYKGETTGTIISIREYHKRGYFIKDMEYYPTYRYIVNGIVYEEEFDLYEEKEDLLQIDQERMIQYDENNPKNFFPADKKNAWRLTAFKDIFVVTSFALLELYKRFY